jgi:hypothetical protein
MIDVKQLVDYVKYTVEEHEKLKEITADTRCSGGGVLNGIRLGGDYKVWSTVEGLQNQIDAFVYDTGLVWYLKFVNGRPTLDKFPWRKSNGKTNDDC